MEKNVSVWSVLFLALIVCESAWGACTTTTFSNWRFDCNGLSRNITCKNSFSFSTGCTNGCSTIGYWSDGGTKYCSGGVVTSRNCDYFGDGTNPRSGMFSGNYQVCDTKCEADSVANYASCIAAGNRWENCECVENTSADSSFVMCNDYVYNGNVTYKAYKVTIHYENHVATSVCGASPSAASGSGYESVCPVVRSGSGSCSQAGIPPNTPPTDCGSSPDCDEAEDPLPSAECYAVVGSKCYFRDVSTRNTYSCDCDGSCQFGYTQMWTGQACHNPYNNPPSSSDSGGGGGGESSPSSSDSGGSSSDSGSGGSSGSGSDKDYTDQLNQIIANTQDIANNTSDISQWTQTTMDNTTDIKNEVSNIGVDVGHIRSNTENVANNTGSIDSKLSTTNNLLNDIKNKNWNPTINVNPPEVNVEVGGDTNIINVEVKGDTNIINADTAKSPSMILQLLETIFGSGYPNDRDTIGKGAEEKRLMDKLDSTLDDGIIQMNGDSVKKAMDGLYSGGFTAVKDSIANSAISDSMGVWAEKITDNGVITGNGSDNCPDVLTRKWNVTFPIGTGGVNVEIGPLGNYMCNDVAGMGITFWGLCRVILRAMVAIACMMWLYKSVLGVDGGSNEED